VLRRHWLEVRWLGFWEACSKQAQDESRSASHLQVASRIR